MSQEEARASLRALHALSQFELFLKQNKDFAQPEFIAAARLSRFTPPTAHGHVPGIKPGDWVASRPEAVLVGLHAHAFDELGTHQGQLCSVLLDVDPNDKDSLPAAGSTPGSHGAQPTKGPNWEEASNGGASSGGADGAAALWLWGSAGTTDHIPVESMLWRKRFALDELRKHKKQQVGKAQAAVARLDAMLSRGDNKVLSDAQQRAAAAVAAGNTAGNTAGSTVGNTAGGEGPRGSGNPVMAAAVRVVRGVWMPKADEAAAGSKRGKALDGSSSEDEQPLKKLKGAEGSKGAGGDGKGKLGKATAIVYVLTWIYQGLFTVDAFEDLDVEEGTGGAGEDSDEGEDDIEEGIVLPTIKKQRLRRWTLVGVPGEHISHAALGRLCTGTGANGTALASAAAVRRRLEAVHAARKAAASKGTAGAAEARAKGQRQRGGSGAMQSAQERVKEGGTDASGAVRVTHSGEVTVKDEDQKKQVAEHAAAVAAATQAVATEQEQAQEEMQQQADERPAPAAGSEGAGSEGAGAEGRGGVYEVEDVIMIDADVGAPADAGTGGADAAAGMGQPLLPQEEDKQQQEEDAQRQEKDTQQQEDEEDAQEEQQQAPQEQLEDGAQQLQQTDEEGRKDPPESIPEAMLSDGKHLTLPSPVTSTPAAARTSHAGSAAGAVEAAAAAHTVQVTPAQDQPSASSARPLSPPGAARATDAQTHTRTGAGAEPAADAGVMLPGPHTLLHEEGPAAGARTGGVSDPGMFSLDDLGSLNFPKLKKKSHTDASGQQPAGGVSGSPTQQPARTGSPFAAPEMQAHRNQRSTSPTTTTGAPVSAPVPPQEPSVPEVQHAAGGQQVQHEQQPQSKLEVLTSGAEAGPGAQGALAVVGPVPEPAHPSESQLPREGVLPLSLSQPQPQPPPQPQPQEEAAEIKAWRASIGSRPGLLSHDLSAGVEQFPVPVFSNPDLTVGKDGQLTQQELLRLLGLGQGAHQWSYCAAEYAWAPGTLELVVPVLDVEERKMSSMVAPLSEDEAPSVGAPARASDPDTPSGWRADLAPVGGAGGAGADTSASAGTWSPAAADMLVDHVSHTHTEHQAQAAGASTAIPPGHPPGQPPAPLHATPAEWSAWWWEQRPQMHVCGARYHMESATKARQRRSLPLVKGPLGGPAMLYPLPGLHECSGGVCEGKRSGHVGPGAQHPRGPCVQLPRGLAVPVEVQQVQGLGSELMPLHGGHAQWGVTAGVTLETGTYVCCVLGELKTSGACARPAGSGGVLPLNHLNWMWRAMLRSIVEGKPATCHQPWMQVPLHLIPPPPTRPPMGYVPDHAHKPPIGKGPLPTTGRQSQPATTQTVPRTTADGMSDGTARTASGTLQPSQPQEVPPSQPGPQRVMGMLHTQSDQTWEGVPQPAVPGDTPTLLQLHHIWQSAAPMGSPWSSLPSRTTSQQQQQQEVDWSNPLLVVDTRSKMGNVASLIRHDTHDPCLSAQVLYAGRCRSSVLYYAALFTNKKVEAGDELTLNWDGL